MMEGKGVLLLVLLWVVWAGEQRCGQLEVVSPRHSDLFTGGFSTSCFQNKAVSFNTCKLLLMQRGKDGCTALTYTHNSCSLHDRTLPSWQPLSSFNKRDIFVRRGHNSSILQMLRLTRNIDPCMSSPERADEDFEVKLPSCLHYPTLIPQSNSVSYTSSLSRCGLKS